MADKCIVAMTSYATISAEKTGIFVCDNASLALECLQMTCLDAHNTNTHTLSLSLSLKGVGVDGKWSDYGVSYRQRWTSLWVSTHTR